jgi:hypothetical protein
MADQIPSRTALQMMAYDRAHESVVLSNQAINFSSHIKTMGMPIASAIANERRTTNGHH